jgi:hypothetical protein
MSYGCRAGFAGEGPADPGAFCGCQNFDASTFIARAAQVQILRELRELFRGYTNALPVGSEAWRAQMALVLEVVERLAVLEPETDELEQESP